MSARRKVIVTGASGFIGGAVLSHFAKSYDVTAISRSTYGPQKANIRHQALDLFDIAAVRDLLDEERPYGLVHCAWARAPDGGLWQSPENAKWGELTKALVAMFHQAGGGRALICGSCAEYEFSQPVLAETHSTLMPSSEYGRVKAELYRSLAEQARESGLSLVWPRIFYLYGPGEDPNRFVPSIIKNLLSDRAAPCSDGTQRRDYSYVEDIAVGLFRLFESGITGPVNLASGHAVQLKTIAQSIGRATGRPDLIRLGAIPNRPGEPEIIQADISKLEAVLNWKPDTTLEQGLGETITAIRNSPEMIVRRA